VLGVVGVAIFFVPTPIVSVFTDDPAVLDVGAESLRYVALSFGFIGIQRAFTGGFRGAGKTLIAAAISIAALAVIRLPVAYVASQGVLPTDLWFLDSPMSGVSGSPSSPRTSSGRVSRGNGSAVAHGVTAMFVGRRVQADPNWTTPTRPPETIEHVHLSNWWRTAY